ncbi:TetR/AcrR family transcriptional regulator [Phycicoccus sp. Soil802]|uniref:TetR/AcrR family transcriptional regulator n=1 Tax=Phycicoccus sp. Soil802 TaxID=1736414 RepID=UPI000702E54F|nr:TetR/AcrR family transcriptional regulator [Phycicoccus sp. Soil802]KRF27938.1 TetR family transcriptional regulator [Phycicoccus sp. Soil802]
MSRLEEIVDAAQRLLEDEGPGAVSMRRLAAELGIQAPSLYKHVDGKDRIEAELQERALTELAAALQPAADLRDLAHAYRQWALLHPRLYELTARRPLRRDQLRDGVETAASARLVALSGGDVDRARALWAAAHGLVDLELAHRFPEGADVQAAWDALVAAFDRVADREDGELDSLSGQP